MRSISWRSSCRHETRPWSPAAATFSSAAATISGERSAETTSSAPGNALARDTAGSPGPDARSSTTRGAPACRPTAAGADADDADNACV